MIINSQPDEGIEMMEPLKQNKQRTLQDVPSHLFEKVLSITQQQYQLEGSNSKKLHTYSLFYIDPTTTRVGLWDFIIIFVTYFIIFQISLTLAFGPTFWDQELKITFAYLLSYIILLVCLIIDIVVCFHKGYYAFGRGKVIDDHDLIVKHYLKIHFPIDISAVILLIVPIFYSSYYINYVQIVPACLLYIKKFKCQEQIVSMLQYRRNWRIFFILFMLICDVLMIGNIGACLFVGMDLLLWNLQYYGSNPQYYWLSNDAAYSANLIDGPWVLQYVFAQSFSTGTLSTLAPGPFPKNPIEVVSDPCNLVLFNYSDDIFYAFSFICWISVDVYPVH